MKILIVSDNSTQDNTIGQKLEEELIRELKDSNYNYKHYNVKNTKIKKCIGCFNCWLKTPGICIYNDITRDICKDNIGSDVYIILSEIKYGCYSSQIKRVLDRSICTILPFFKDVNGEMHHAPRYDKYPQLVFLGYGSYITTEEEKTFRRLNQANAINFQIDKSNTYICKNSETTENSIHSLLGYIKQKEGEI